MKTLISYEVFQSLDLRIGTVIACNKKEGSEKLLRLEVNFGEDGIKIIFSAIAQWYSPQSLIGKSYVFILNLQPRKMMDEYSEGMLLAADGEKPVPLIPEVTVIAGTLIR